MATYKARGIILKRRNFFEADRIITVLTKYRGKLKILAKGVRRSLSKNAGSIELFVLCDLVLAEGRNFDVLTGVEIVKSFKGVRGDLKKMAIACQLAELTDQILEEKQEHPDIYNLLKRVLEYLNRAEISKDNLIFDYYALRSVSQVGFAPQLGLCVECGQRLKKEKNYFSPKAGGILCLRCASSDKIVIEVTPNQIKLLRLFLEKDVSLLSRVKTTEKDIETLKNIISYYLKYVIEKELKSDKFAKKINELG